MRAAPEVVLSREGDVAWRGTLLAFFRANDWAREPEERRRICLGLRWNGYGAQWGGGSGPPECLELASPTFRFQGRGAFGGAFVKLDERLIAEAHHRLGCVVYDRERARQDPGTMPFGFGPTVNAAHADFLNHYAEEAPCSPKSKR